jgi:predicted nucleic acid-binding protein
MSISPVCIDASLVMRLIRPDTQAARLKTLWNGWRHDGRPLIAPTLMFYEITNGLRRLVRHGDMTLDQAVRLLDAALRLPITLFGDPQIHRRAIELAVQFSLPASYDAHYLALSEHMRAEFWTADAKLSRAVEPTLTWVHLIDDNEGSTK